MFILFSNNNIVQVLLFELFIKLLIFTAGELKNRNEQLKGLQARFEIFMLFLRNYWMRFM